VPQPAAVITVTELNRLARLALEKAVPSCWVAGEISNLTRANSGHWYFTLKDEQAGVRCAFFRNRNQFLDWAPTEGDKVEVRAQVTLYEPRGDYQLLVDAMRRSGQGSIYEEFIKLKSKLEAEGLFRADQKQSIPKFPKCLGIVTSLQAAALHDVLNTLGNRWPSCPIVIYPASVQGSDAALMLRKSLSTAISRNECDVILIVRGGGSLEDLTPFNDEQLARLIHASPIPIITGIGHETDFSIADFVADRRAATPTAAAQIATQDRHEMDLQVKNLLARNNKAMARMIYQEMQHLDGISRRVLHPGSNVKKSKNDVVLLKRRLELSCNNNVYNSKKSLEIKTRSLQTRKPNLQIFIDRIQSHAESLKTNLIKIINKNESIIKKHTTSLYQLSPTSILARGYCLAFDENGNILRKIESLHIGQKVAIKMNAGAFKATVEQISPSTDGK
jgi:exodeoxyribonuclease VII large subunit